MLHAGQVTEPGRPEQRCGPLGSTHLRTTLYFGLAKASGAVSERQCGAFSGEEVTPRFPEGLTVWQANGQWRRSDGNIGRERAKVLLLVHDDSTAVHQAVAAIIERYKALFQQESVLWETAPVCATF